MNSKNRFINIFNTLRQLKERSVSVKFKHKKIEPYNFTFIWNEKEQAYIYVLNQDDSDIILRGYLGVSKHLYYELKLDSSGLYAINNKLSPAHSDDNYICIEKIKKIPIDKVISFCRVKRKVDEEPYKQDFADFFALYKYVR